VSTPKEIGRLAGRMFASIVPKNWALRSQEDQEDYGVDYEVELTTPNDKPTGFIFKIQQKGVGEATRLADGTISFGDLKTEKVTYYLRQLRIPIVFVVVDLASSKSYWIPLHANRDVEAALSDAIAKGHATMTVHLPATNVLPETVDDLLAAVQRMMDALTIQGLKAMPTANAQAIIASEPDIDELEKGLRFTQSLLRSTKTQRLIERGDYEDAFKLNEKAFSDDAEPIEVRFAAGMELVRIAGGVLVRQGQRGREELMKLRLRVHHALVRICRPLPSAHQLRFYSLFLARTSRLHVRVNRDVGLFFSSLAQEAAPDELARYVTAGARRESTVAITADLRRAQRLILELIQRGWIGLVVYAWSELTEAVIPFLMRLEKDGLGAAAAAIRDWLNSVGTLCREIVVELKDDSVVGLCAVNHARVDLDTDSFAQRLAESRELAGKIVDPEQRRITASQLDRLEQIAAKKSRDVPEGHDQEGLEQLVRLMAHGLGIDLDDPDDRIASVARIGLRDANPERVLRDCQHLVVQLGSRGVPAQMLGLPTAGSKDLACRKHGYRTSALSLDDLYGFFRSSHCDGCPDREPHPPDWKWTPAWQQDQEQRWERDRRALRERRPAAPETSSAGAAGAMAAVRLPPRSERSAKDKAKRKKARDDRKRNRRNR